MPVLPCPLGARCTDGEDGAIWKSVDIAFEQAQALVTDHVRFAHQYVADEEAPEFFLHQWNNTHTHQCTTR